MPSKPPFFRQSRYDTCALACLRMILAQHGIDASEDELIHVARIEEGGLDIEELARLAERYGLQPTIRQLPLDDISGLLSRERFPIVYLNRYPIDAQFAVHAVIPFRISTRFVSFLDPLQGERRVSKRGFEACRRYLAYFGVVCAPLGAGK